MGFFEYNLKRHTVPFFRQTRKHAQNRQQGIFFHPIVRFYRENVFLVLLQIPDQTSALRMKNIVIVALLDFRMGPKRLYLLVKPVKFGCLCGEIKMNFFSDIRDRDFQNYRSFKIRQYPE